MWIGYIRRGRGILISSTRIAAEHAVGIGEIPQLDYPE
jgi:hypothetical protein